jgi:hypothetical protein
MTASPRIDTPLGPVTFVVRAGDAGLSVHRGSGRRRAGSHRVSIGGPDEERLLEESGVEGSVEYVDDRTITWRSPSELELTIAVAWSGPTEHPATWYAIDLPFKKN